MKKKLEEHNVKLIKESEFLQQYIYDNIKEHLMGNDRDILVALIGTIGSGKT